VRKSMLYRATPLVLGTVPCNWAAENKIMPPGGAYYTNVLLFDLLLSFRLLPSIGTNVLRALSATSRIPLLIIVNL
jgi:hypothetical protein